VDAASQKLRIAERPGLIIVRGPLRDNATHRHHALQISIAVAGMVRLDDAAPSSNVVIRPDHPHRLDADDALTLLVDPETTLARHVIATVLDEAPLCRDAALDHEPQLGRLLARLRDPRELELPIDERIADVLEWMDRLLGEGRTREITLGAALRRACLSESRFLHLFREEAGTTWRRALIWRRALHAMRLAQSGLSLTDSAHRSGYADSAHLSRQFKELFGLSPSLVSKNSSFVQAHELLEEHTVDS
jgi:AraC family transcriptional regulator